MDGTPQNAPDAGVTLYDQMRTAGFSHDEVKDLAPPEPDQTEKPEQAAPAPVSPPAKAPDIPPPPPPVPGTYNPEQEQNALRSADAITDPEMRMKTKSALKREYANDRIMDGISSAARETAKTSAIASYAKAVRDIRDDTKTSWEKKQAIVKLLTKTMWNDPRLAVGETQTQTEGYMMSIAGMDNPRELGDGFTKMFQGVVTGEVSSANQILKARADHLLTAKGTDEVYKAFMERDKADKSIANEQRNLAYQRAKNIIMKDLDEASPIPELKPSAKHYQKLNDVQYAISQQAQEAGDDMVKMRKILSPENVEATVNDVYPPLERHFDYVNKGANQTVGGVTIPPGVAPDEKTQNNYRWIVGAPPSVTNTKTGKQETPPPAGWQKAVDMLLANPDQAANFDKRFPLAVQQGMGSAKILKNVRYTAPPPGATPPVVQPAQGPSFWSTVGSRLFPPPGEGVKSLQVNPNETPIADAISRGLNVISPVPAEAKK